MLAPILLITAAAVAQEPPQVKVNYLNVCTPSDADRRQLEHGLATFSAVSRFSPEFDVTRGTQEAEHGLIRFIRVRREFAAPAALSSAQYSLSTDSKGTTETLILKPRDSKQIVQLMIEHSTGSGTPSSLLRSSAPADRIRLERFGTTAIVLARCPDADQSAFSSLFSSATAEMRSYKLALQSSTLLPSDVSWVDRGTAAATPARRKR